MYADFEPLSYYLSISKKIIAKLGPTIYSGLAHEMLKSEEAIGDVAHALMKADVKWNPNYKSVNNTVCSLSSLRILYAWWAILKYVKNKHKKHDTLSLDYDVDNKPLSNLISSCKRNPTHQLEDKEYVDYILSSLTPTQSSYIYSYYIEGKTFAEIGKEHGITKQGVEYTIKYGLSRLKSTYQTNSGV